MSFADLIEYLGKTEKPGEVTEEDGWILQATDTENYVGAPVANGGIGILPWSEPFSVRHVIMNHVFERNGPRGISRVIKGINPFPLKLFIDRKEITKSNITEWKQIINMKEATHNTYFTFPGKAKVSYSIAALRHLPCAGIVRVKIEALSDISIRLENAGDVPEEEYQKCETEFHDLSGGKFRVYCHQKHAKTKYGAYEVSTGAGFIHEPNWKIEHKKETQFATTTAKAGETVSISLVGVICTTRDYHDTFGESERQFIFALMDGDEVLMKKHQNMWNELWKGDVEIEGDLASQRIVRFALFNLYSFGRENSRLSISPMGLSCQFYNGHIFWDTELWMYPPLLLLNQPIAKSLIDYRLDRTDSARKRAYAHGYYGLMYPWESDDSGDEATPTWAFTGPLEHHVTGDIAIALWNYYLVSKDKVWLAKAYPVLKGIAEFWISRVTKNDDGSYSIEKVVGADEYAINIDDNAFTNGVAIKALQFATLAAKEVGEEAPAIWDEVASKIKLWRFDDGTIKEYKTYDGQMIKQADTNLLGYPLGIETEEEMKRDLEYYAPKIDPDDGPAMAYSIFCIEYARLNDSVSATECYKKCFGPNLRPPFGVLSETPTSQNPYFATGAGGLLQAVINGFCGLEITSEGIVQLPSVLPTGWTKLTVKGVGPERKTFTRTA